MKNKKTAYIVILVVSVLLLVVIVYYIIRFFIYPSLEEGKFETARVERGSVILTTPAQGTVAPESEVVILSPAASIIQRIVRDAGSRVNRGDVILILDPKPIQDEIERIEDQLQVKRNNLQKNRLNARETRLDLSYNVEVKKLKIASIKSQLADQEQLLEVGGISPAQYDKTKQELTLAEKDLDMLLEKNSIRLKQLEAEEDGLLLQIEIQEKELEEKQETLIKMVVRAGSAGIVLAVNGKVGEKVEKDRLLLRLSNLSTFKINGSMDERFADQIKTGGEVFVLLDKTRLNGRIGTIKPVIENNSLQYDIFLNQSDHPKLISNLNVNLLIVKEKRDSVLRIKNGPAFSRGNQHEVFRLGSEEAVRIELTTGLKGDEYTEIISGTREGDELIISEISAFKRSKDVEIRAN
ncbi:MAG: efflux RND transporter periplasmic adaptor subunit [Bacteroidales bacterium]|nr:efflux RND transporter periplasmic adaptor subunit [Bacteroidales bacterium]